MKSAPTGSSALAEARPRVALGCGGLAQPLVEIGAWLGLATAVAAWYASFAAVTNSTFGRTVLPVRPLRR